MTLVRCVFGAGLFFITIGSLGMTKPVLVDKQDPHSIAFHNIFESGPRTPDHLNADLQALDTDLPKDFTAFQVGLDYLELASADRWDYLRLAEKFFQQAMAYMPDNPYVMMYLGRSLGGQALDTRPSVVKRLKTARMAFKLMDQAVDKSPDCFWLRLLRADAQLYAHPVLRRGARLREDTDFLKIFLSSEQFHNLPDFTKSRVFLCLGSYDAKTDPVQSMAFLKRAERFGAGTFVAREARARLEGSYRSLGYDEATDAGR